MEATTVEGMKCISDMFFYDDEHEKEDKQH